MELQWLIEEIRGIEDEAALRLLVMEIHESYGRLRPELESVHLLLPKYDRQERKRQVDFCRARLLTEEFEK